MSIAAASATPGADDALRAPRAASTAPILVARRAGYDRVVTFDMGGTSTDVALCLDGAAAADPRDAGRRVPGQGAERRRADHRRGRRLDRRRSPPATGSLRVGPQSAGADPGPAAYGRGGTEATVTDANLVLGHLPPRLVGGAMTLDVELRPRGRRPRRRSAWRRAARRPRPRASIDIVNENMLGALRVVTVQRGRRPAHHRAGGLRRGRPAARQRAGPPARRLPRDRAARPRRPLGAGLRRRRLRQRVQPDPDPPARRPRARRRARRGSRRSAPTPAAG